MSTSESFDGGLPKSLSTKKVFSGLSEILPKRDVLESSAEFFKEITLMTFIISLLNDAWDEVEVDHSKGQDFYSDGMLGYTTCEYISDHAFSLVESSDEDDAEELTDALMKYLHFNIMHNGLGDITKRIVSAISSVAFHSPAASNILEAHVVLMQTETNFEWFVNDPCNSISLEIHRDIQRYLVEILEWLEENTTN